MKKYNKFDYLSIFIAIASFFVIYILILSKGNVFYGSTMDYANQHYLIPEYFRTLFYETKDFFPSFALNLGMGQNIYNFSYYGLFNPIILISYLLPFINMSSYIEIASILVIILDIILLYYWVSTKTEDKKIRFISVFLFTMASPITLHSHRHIMFVNYMPFLIMGLISIDKYLKENKIIMLILSILFIITTSYFFSIPALIVLFIYAVFNYLKENKQVKTKDFIIKHLKLAWLFIVPILISGVLLLPTLKAILNSRFNTTNLISLKELLIPNISLSPFVYNSYSMGLTSIIILAIINSIISKEKHYKFLGMVFALIMVFPVIEYILNGFMYLNAKVFIPFIPLAILLIIKLIQDITSKKTNIKVLLITTIIISIIGSLSFKMYKLYIIDLIITIIGILILYKKQNKLPLIIILIITSLTTSIVVNIKDELASKEIENNQYNKNITNLITNETKKDDNIYRTVDTTKELFNSNNIRDISEYKTTMYSSLTNKNYKNYYWYISETENPNRNDAIFTDISNPIFNIMFGNKYYLTTEKAPIGYKKMSKSKDIKMYTNDDVFTLGYASNNLMSLKDFNKLSYPYNIEALLNNIVIDKNINTNYNTKIKKNNNTIYNPANAEIQNSKYILNLKEKKTYKLTRENYNPNNLLIIKFKMEYTENCKIGDTAIKINEVENKLTCKGWKYHNNNYTFTYILSPAKDLNIEIEKGKYIISNIETYELNYNEIKNIKQTHDEFKINKNETKGDIIKGTINVTKESSYFNLAVPYDEGYNIYIDGKKTSYEKTNTSFVGFKIEKGNHDIKIEYIAPWQKIGKIVSLAGIISFLLTAVISKGVKKDEKNINDSTMLQ